MEETIGFEEAWPALEKKLRGALAGRRVPADFRDDILQETGLRLFRNWNKVRPDSSWAFALTIALNLVRDEMRRRERQDPTRLEAPTHHRDAEQDALVRIELQRVSDAMATMSARQRSILLAEIGERSQSEIEGAALKMARMRARRRLRSMLEQASGFVLLGFDRVRRLVGTSDAAYTGALSAMGRPVAVASLTALGVLGALGPDASPLFKGGLLDPADRATQTISIAEPERVPALRAAEIIENVGTDDERIVEPDQDTAADEAIVIDPTETEIPPYEAEHEVAPSTFGENETRVGVGVSHEGTECEGTQPTSVCTGGGGAAVTLTVAAGGEEREITVGSGNASAPSRR